MPPVLVQPSLIPAASFPAGGPQVVQNAGKAGEAWVAEIHDRYYYQTLSGNMFFGSGPVAGIAIPVFSATAQVFGLWNPAGSGKNLVPVGLDIGGIVAPIILSEFCLSTVTGLGAQAATGGPVTAFTAGVPRNCLLGGGNASVANFISSSLTLTTGPTMVNTAPLGVSVYSTTAAYSMGVLHYDFQGRLIITPGSAAFLTAAIAETSGTVPGLWWYEAPL